MTYYPVKEPSNQAPALFYCKPGSEMEQPLQASINHTALHVHFHFARAMDSTLMASCLGLPTQTQWNLSTQLDAQNNSIPESGRPKSKRQEWRMWVFVTLQIMKGSLKLPCLRQSSNWLHATHSLLPPRNVNVPSLKYTCLHNAVYFKHIIKES